jgi:hypothetical protein
MRSVKRNDSSKQEVQPSRRTNLQRRGFLLTLGVGSAGAAAVAVRTLSAGSVAPGAASEPDANGDGYRLTDHVRRYYQTVKV